MMRVGVDVGGTNIRAALMEDDGTIIREAEDLTEAHRGKETVISKVVHLVREVRGETDVKGVGVGCPGPLDAKTGIILSPPNLPGWNRVPLASILQESFQLPVNVDNDANVAALAEARVGAGVGSRSVYYITISTGVGGGLIIDGEVFQGAQGYAGEIGNMIMVPNGPTHEGGLNAGALENLVSGTAIGRAGMRAGILGGAEGVFREAKAGNLQAASIVDEAIDYLAMGLANLIHALNPEVFVLGGGVMKSEDLFLMPLQERIKKYVYPGLQDSINVIPAKLGPKAGVVGAGMLVK